MAKLLAESEARVSALTIDHVKALERARAEFDEEVRLRKQLESVSRRHLSLVCKRFVCSIELRAALLFFISPYAFCECMACVCQNDT